MTVSARPSLDPLRTLAVRPSAPPAWIAPWLGGVPRWSPRADGAGEERLVIRGDVLWASLRVPFERTPDGTQAAVAGAYRRLHAILARGDWAPVRFWNFVPGILDVFDDGSLRYMSFNAGRFDAFDGWLLDESRPSGGMVAGTGVGSDESVFQVQCLATVGGSRPVENPRQIPSRQYSRRYGARPPLFARATQLDDAGLVFVSGTASIVGESSTHLAHLDDQLEETVQNLRCVQTTARAAVASPRATGDAPATRHAEDRGDAAYASLRAYVKHDSDVARVLARLQDAFPEAGRIEWTVTDLCRPELLVEVEGVVADAATRAEHPAFRRGPVTAAHGANAHANANTNGTGATHGSPTNGVAVVTTLGDAARDDASPVRRGTTHGGTNGASNGSVPERTNV